jgi:hypothetical protein
MAKIKLRSQAEYFTPLEYKEVDGRAFHDAAVSRKELPDHKLLELYKIMGLSLEVTRMPYVNFRIEDSDLDNDDMTKLHQESFINDVIPKKIKENIKSNRKVRILSLGAGIGAYAEQIRQAFPEDVRVFTTGLNRRYVELARANLAKYTDLKNPKESDLPESDDQREYVLEKASMFLKFKNLIGDKPLTQDDFKWQSITQLKDFPEFDLIEDTYGEFLYDSNAKPELVENYLILVIKKLLPGGRASIVPVTFEEGSYNPIVDILERLKKTLNEKNGFEYSITNGLNGTGCLKINKI